MPGKKARLGELGKKMEKEGKKSQAECFARMKAAMEETEPA